MNENTILFLKIAMKARAKKSLMPASIELNNGNVIKLKVVDCKKL